jgi:hypothetical protein
MLSMLDLSGSVLISSLIDNSQSVWGILNLDELLIITHSKWSFNRKWIFKHLLYICYMEVEFIVKIDIMHVEGPPTQLTQIIVFNPFIFIHAYIVMEAWVK